jgi:hypothetical protein
MARGLAGPHLTAFPFGCDSQVMNSIRETMFAHPQSDDDTLLGPVESNGTAKLRSHTSLYQLASEALDLFGRYDERPASFSST